MHFLRVEQNSLFNPPLIPQNSTQTHEQILLKSIKFIESNGNKLHKTKPNPTKPTHLWVVDIKRLACKTLHSSARSICKDNSSPYKPGKESTLPIALRECVSSVVKPSPSVPCDFLGSTGASHLVWPFFWGYL